MLYDTVVGCEQLNKDVLWFGNGKLGSGINCRTDEPKRVLQSACLSRAQDFGGFFDIPWLDPQNSAETSLASRCSGHSSQVDFG